MMAVLPTRGGGIEEAQHLPEGQVPWLHRKVRPYGFISNLRRQTGDGLRLEIGFARFREVPGVPG
jgi:hypothetical protein